MARAAAGTAPPGRLAEVEGAPQLLWIVKYLERHHINDQNRLDEEAHERVQHNRSHVVVVSDHV